MINLINFIVFSGGTISSGALKDKANNSNMETTLTTGVTIKISNEDAKEICNKEASEAVTAANCSETCKGVQPAQAYGSCVTNCTGGTASKTRMECCTRLTGSETCGEDSGGGSTGGGSTGGGGTSCTCRSEPVGYTQHYTSYSECSKYASTCEATGYGNTYGICSSSSDGGFILTIYKVVEKHC